MKIIGVDFTSAPKRDKRIVVAVCSLDQGLAFEKLLEFSDWPAYELWLGAPDSWIGGFDFPFGLPKRFVERQNWPATWPDMVRKCVSAGKESFVDEAMQAFKAAKSPQDKHRKTDLQAGSHSPLKTKTNPPVGRMFYEGAWRLLSHGIHIPMLNETGSSKVALEAYPGFLARKLGFHRYKNDKPTSAKACRQSRRDILQKLGAGAPPLGIKLQVPTAITNQVCADESGDIVDAILCAAQAAWAAERPRFGLPAHIESCEGWIVSA